MERDNLPAGGCADVGLGELPVVVELASAQDSGSVQLAGEDGGGDDRSAVGLDLQIGGFVVFEPHPA